MGLLCFYWYSATCHVHIHDQSTTEHNLMTNRAPAWSLRIHPCCRRCEKKNATTLHQNEPSGFILYNILRVYVYFTTNRCRVSKKKTRLSFFQRHIKHCYVIGCLDFIFRLYHNYWIIIIIIIFLVWRVLPPIHPT